MHQKPNGWFDSFSRDNDYPEASLVAEQRDLAQLKRDMIILCDTVIQQIPGLW